MQQCLEEQTRFKLVHSLQSPGFVNPGLRRLRRWGLALLTPMTGLEYRRGKLVTPLR